MWVWVGAEISPGIGKKKKRDFGGDGDDGALETRMGALRLFIFFTCFQRVCMRVVGVC